MGIFDLFRRKGGERKSYSWGGGRGYNAGEGFTRDTAGSSAYAIPYLPIREHDSRNSSIVAAVAGWAMRNVVQPAARVEKELPNGEWEPQPKHLCASIVRKPQGLIAPEDRSNLNYRRMLRVIAWSLVFDGNWYLLKLRNGSGKVIGLDWLPHTAVIPVEREGHPSIIDAYEIKTLRGTQRIPRADMVHGTTGVDPAHPAMGCSALKSVMRFVMTDNQIAVFSHAVLRNPFPGVVITPKDANQVYTKEDMDSIVRSLAQVSGGERGAGVAAFTDALNIDTLGYSPDDMAVRELARLPEERITAVFGIPAIVAGMGAGLERSTFANFEQAREAATEEFLVPLWDDIAEAFTEQLLPEFEKNPDGFRLTLDYSGVKALQEDTDAMHVRVREDFKANLYDRAAAKTALGMESGPEDEGVFAYQLRPAAPTIQEGKNNQTRASAEDLV